MAKDFYDKKFGVGIMSAQKVKEMITSLEKSNFNTLISYSKQSDTLGYAIAYKSDKILHYSYPFYDLMSAPKDMGLGMMIKAVILAQEKNLSYVYLGSLQRKTDTYKMQFEGMEWWNGKTWSKNIEEAKIILKSLE
jgi:arginyl-tRNA--protein-N-Asp/Glu arginylyltransferase